jgi:hypothetical protein
MFDRDIKIEVNKINKIKASGLIKTDKIVLKKIKDCLPAKPLIFLRKKGSV